MTEFKRGDLVKVLRAFGTQEGPGWDSRMDHTVGATAEVARVISDINWIELDFPGIGTFRYLPGVLELAATPSATPSAMYGSHTIDPEVKINTVGEPVSAENRYPHKCPHCGGPAYIGLGPVDCSAGCNK